MKLAAHLQASDDEILNSLPDTCISEADKVTVRGKFFCHKQLSIKKNQQNCLNTKYDGTWSRVIVQNVWGGSMVGTPLELKSAYISSLMKLALSF